MTGSEFEDALKAAGFKAQADFARVMGVHRQTIGKQCQADKVEVVWVYALAGVVAANSANAVVSIVGKIDRLE